MKPSQRGDVLWTAKGKSSVGSVSRLWDVSWNYLQNNREIQSLEKAVEMTNSPDTNSPGNSQPGDTAQDPRLDFYFFLIILHNI